MSKITVSEGTEAVKRMLEMDKKVREICKLISDACENTSNAEKAYLIFVIKGQLDHISNVTLYPKTNKKI